MDARRMWLLAPTRRSRKLTQPRAPLRLAGLPSDECELPFRAFLVVVQHCGRPPG